MFATRSADFPPVTKLDYKSQGNCLMKYQKLIDELNDVLESTSHCRKKHQETLKTFLNQFKAEEEKLTKKLQNASDDERCNKWKRKLGKVREAYELLEA